MPPRRCPGGGGPPPFAVVTKDAREVSGPFTLWQKDDKVWIELRPEQWGQPFLLSPKLRTGIGEQMVLGGLMAYPVAGAGGPQVAEFVRVHNTVRLQARNMDVVATPGTPTARVVESGYSASLLGSTPVASQPHPERKSVLVEANGLFLSDMLGVGMMLQRAFRQGYSLDGRNSVITAVRGSAEATVIETQNHYYTGAISVPQPGGPPGVPAPSIPNFVPDSRSLLIGHHYSLAPLPALPMAGRRADPRIGHFWNTTFDFSDDTATTPRKRVIQRWRLEKKDPAAEMSEPVKPITFWIDRNVPLAFRAAVVEGVLEWNKAFERIGFKGAIAVRQQPEDATWDTLDFGYASIRWMFNVGLGFGAIGPSHVDPRSGEILDADIAVEGLDNRTLRLIRTQLIASPLFSSPPFDEAVPGVAPPTTAAAHAAHPGHEQCLHAELAAQQLGYAMDVLEARGQLTADGERAQQFVQDYVRQVVMHEVGHTLGLRHNFRASRIYSEAQLADEAFTRANGTTGSVMEYSPINLPSPGEAGGTPFQLTLGPYDYWAVEYAYKVIPADAQVAELQRIAARSSDPLLAYGTDEDNALGIDPETVQMDLGDDPIAFAAKRLAIARDLFDRQESRTLPPDQDYSVLRRSLNYAVGDVARSVEALTRQIGGVRTLRDYAGSGRDPLQPVPAAVQRQALDLIVASILSADGLRVSPGLQRKLAPDFMDRAEIAGVTTDYPVPQRLLSLQRGVLGYLMSDTVAARILDSEGKVAPPEQPFLLAELYARLTQEVWGELATGGDIAAPRRDLQREHLNRMTGALLRTGPQIRADARSLLRFQAQELLGRLKAAARSGKPGVETRAHVADSIDTLQQALSAPMQRVGL